MRTPTITATIVAACTIVLSISLPLSFGMELTSEATGTTLHPDVRVGLEPVVAMPCFGPPDELLRLGGQRILHYLRMPSAERLQACLGGAATDEMYVLVNGYAVISEFVLTTRDKRPSVSSAGVRDERRDHFPGLRQFGPAGPTVFQETEDNQGGRP